MQVNVDNFVRAETDRMFDGILQMTGGTNKWIHFRAPTPIDKQTVIRMNRDTLYSAAIVDLEKGATLTIPDTAGRYLSAMVVNEDHYINKVFQKPGDYVLTKKAFDSRFVLVAVRILVNPSDPGDVAIVNMLQDALKLEAGSAEALAHPNYDENSRKAAADALIELSHGISDTKGMFGARADVDPVRHLIGTASAWGGLPESEAFYYIDSEPRSVGTYTLTLKKDVPVDGFWSLSVYNRDGLFGENPYSAYNLSNVTAKPDSDGTVTITLASEPKDAANFLYIMDGWNYALRLYRPWAEVLDGTWTPPEIVRA